MDTYSLLREIADSWVLLALFVFLHRCDSLGVSPRQPRDAPRRGDIPFRHEDHTRRRRRPDAKEAQP